MQQYRYIINKDNVTTSVQADEILLQVFYPSNNNSENSSNYNSSGEHVTNLESEEKARWIYEKNNEDTISHMQAKFEFEVEDESVFANRLVGGMNNGKASSFEGTSFDVKNGENKFRSEDSTASVGFNPINFKNKKVSDLGLKCV